MRRGIAATALVASLALAATACGGSDDSGDSADGPVTITWWDTSNATNEAPTYQALVKEFEAANKDVKVKYVNVPFDQAQNKFDTAAGSKGAPDVLRSEVGWTPAFAKKGFFLPLDGTEALADQAKFKPNLIEQAKYEGKTYGVPIVTDTLALVYNKALFAKAGITEAPKSWDDLKKAAATIKDKTGVDGYWGSTQAYYAQSFLHGEGTDTVDADGKKITVNSAEAKKAYGTWLGLFDGKGLHKADTTADAYAHIQDAFVNGKVAAIVQGPWEITNFYKGSAFKDKGNLGIATVPAGFHRQGGRPDRRPQPLGLRPTGRRPPEGRAEVPQLHDLREVPGGRRAEELHAADPRRRLHRRGQGRPGHHAATRRCCPPPSRARRCRSTAPCGAPWTPNCPRSRAARSPSTRV